MIRAFVARDDTGAIQQLREVVQRYFGEMPLERLHDGASYPLFDRASDQSTSIHRAFYERVVPEPSWNAAFMAFVRGVVRPAFGEPIAYQSIPTFRVHLPGNVAVGEFHTDRQYGHAAETVNVWVPLTDADATATIHIAPSPDPTPPEGCRPVDVAFGHYLVFDGVNFIHGNRTNEEGYTRVSIDLRVIPMAAYRDSDERSVNTGARLAVGDYYDVCS